MVCITLTPLMSLILCLVVLRPVYTCQRMRIKITSMCIRVSICNARLILARWFCSSFTLWSSFAREHVTNNMCMWFAPGNQTWPYLYKRRWTKESCYFEWIVWDPEDLGMCAPVSKVEQTERTFEFWQAMWSYLICIPSSLWCLKTSVDRINTIPTRILMHIKCALGVDTL